jgi:hypothetical protein
MYLRFSVILWTNVYPTTRKLIFYIDNILSGTCVLTKFMGYSAPKNRKNPYPKEMFSPMY